MTTQIPFRKMNGLGNDFVVVDVRAGDLSLSDDQIRAIGDRQTGIGFDQFIAIEAAPGGIDAFMRIHNQDGGEVDACGNATRCVGRLLMDETGSQSAAILTSAGSFVARAFNSPALVRIMPLLKPTIKKYRCLC